MRLSWIIVTLSLSCSVAAQSFEQTTGLSISEPPMSTRAAAMGGASDALDHDAADLASNPALMAGTTRIRFSLSGAQSTYDVQRFSIGEHEVSLRGAARQQRSLAHVSAVIPINGLVVGLYAREEPRLRDGNLHYAEGAAPYAPVCVQEPCLYAYLLGVSEFERRDRRYGVTAAFERGAFAFGAGAEVQDLDEQYAIVRGAYVTSFGFERMARRVSRRGIAPNAGMRWKVSPRIAVAVAYNGAVAREASDEACLVELATARCESSIVPIGSSSSPGVGAWRASASFKPMDRLVLTGQAVRRNHGDFADRQTDVITAPVDTVHRNATDFHAGAEYRLQAVPVALRAGWWREDSKTDSRDLLGTVRGPIEHRTYGLGFELRSARLDVSYDDAEAPALRRAMVAVTF